MSRPMVLEHTLADRANARGSDPVTSLEAAEGVNVSEKQRIVLRAAMNLTEGDGGATPPFTAQAIYEMADGLNRIVHPNAKRLGGSTVRSRLKELCDADLMQVADRDGITESGRRCARYRITDAGVAYLKGGVR